MKPQLRRGGRGFRYRGRNRRVTEAGPMHTTQPTQAPAQSDDDRIRQIEEDLLFLHWQLWKIHERFHYVQEQLIALDLSSA